MTRVNARAATWAWVVLAIGFTPSLAGASFTDKLRFYLGGGYNRVDYKDLNSFIRDRRNAYSGYGYANLSELNSAFDVQFEMVYDFSRLFGFGLGAEYLFFSKSGDYGYQDEPISIYREDWQLSAFSAGANLYAHLPLGDSLTVFASAGASYNFGTLKRTRNEEWDWRSVNDEYYGNASLKMDVKSRAPDYHAAIGLEYEFTPNFSFVLRGGYRYLKLKDFSGNLTYTEDYWDYSVHHTDSEVVNGSFWTYQYSYKNGPWHPSFDVKDTAPADSTDYRRTNVRHSELDLSGLSLQAGLKYALGPRPESAAVPGRLEGLAPAAAERRERRLRFGLRAGARLSSFFGKDAEGSGVRFTGLFGGFVLFGTGEVQFQAEVDYAQQGATVDLGEGYESVFKLEYLEVPLLVKMPYGFSDGSVYLGPVLAFSRGTSMILSGGGESVSMNIENGRSFCLGLVCGLDRFWEMKFGGRFYLDLRTILGLSNPFVDAAATAGNFVDSTGKAIKLLNLSAELAVGFAF
jgi:opacity protein-like surface antigen